MLLLIALRSVKEVVACAYNARVAQPSPAVGFGFGFSKYQLAITKSLGFALLLVATG
jgi:hypothetical protein